MKKQQNQVQEFHKKFGHPISEKVVMMPDYRVKVRGDWLDEEIGEFRDARTIQRQADAMIDIIYFALGTMVEIGIDIEPLFDIVHDANMAKLQPDGTVKLSSEGKVIKPDNWVDPVQPMADEIYKQFKVGIKKEMDG